MILKQCHRTEPEIAISATSGKWDSETIAGLLNSRAYWEDCVYSSVVSASSSFVSTLLCDYRAEKAYKLHLPELLCHLLINFCQWEKKAGTSSSSASSPSLCVWLGSLRRTLGSSWDQHLWKREHWMRLGQREVELWCIPNKTSPDLPGALDGSSNGLESHSCISWTPVGLLGLYISLFISHWLHWSEVWI